MPRGLGVPLEDLKKCRTPHGSPNSIPSFLSSHLFWLLVQYIGCLAVITRIPQTIMGSISEFPRIKEIRTFVIDGVGSGGDYHNVWEAPDPIVGHEE